MKIKDNIMNEYTESILDFEDDLLKELRFRAARENDNVPILRKDAAAFLASMSAMIKPVKILEAGTAIGYSALVMAKTVLPLLADSDKSAFHIDTVELDEDRAVIAKRNIERAGFSGNIRVITGDATEVFSYLSGSYDMIFVDSSKGHYIEMYDDMKRLLRPGGSLLCDNVVFYGKINDEPQNAPHKHRTIVSRLRSFLERLCGDEDFVTSIIETGDGMAIAVKKERL